MGDIGPIPFVQLVIDGKLAGFIDHQGQGELPEIVASLLVAPALSQLGAPVKGIDERVVVRGVEKKTLIPSCVLEGNI